MPDNNEYRIKLNFGSNVINNMSGVLTLEGENQISLGTGDSGQPLLTMSIYNTKGEKIAKINRNRWMFNEKDRFETVLNASSLKLTDKVSGHCLIEINLLDKNIMQIPHGKFYTHYGQLVEVTSSLYRIEGVEVKNNIIDACGKAFVVA